MTRSVQRMAAVLAVLTPILAGCTSSFSAPPTAPTTSPSPTLAPAPAGERWNLTATLSSITGPCVSDEARESIGEPLAWLMTIERSGESIHIIVAWADDPSDILTEYDGTVVEGVLMADIQSITARTTSCGQVLAEAHVSGRFSGDGNALTAEDVKSYQLYSGETQRASYDWSAVRQ